VSKTSVSRSPVQVGTRPRARAEAVDPIFVHVCASRFRRARHGGLVGEGLRSRWVLMPRLAVVRRRPGPPRSARPRLHAPPIRAARVDRAGWRSPRPRPMTSTVGPLVHPHGSVPFQATGGSGPATASRAFQHEMGRRARWPSAATGLSSPPYNPPQKRKKKKGPLNKSSERGRAHRA